MTDEKDSLVNNIRRKEAIERREQIRAMPKGPARREAKRMNKLIATIDQLLDAKDST